MWVVFKKEAPLFFSFKDNSYLNIQQLENKAKPLKCIFFL